MSKNLKREYIKKLLGIETKNGYKINVGQYLYGVAHGDEYPKLYKVIEETPEAKTISSIYYFKYYDGTGKYFQEVYKIPNNNDTWNISNKISEKVIEQNNRFSLPKLIKLAEAI